MAPLEDRVDADPVEGPPDEIHLPGEPHEAHPTRGLEDDLVARRGEVVGPVAGAHLAEGVAEGHRPLARAPKGQDGVAQLLDLGEPALVECGVHHHPRHASIGRRPFEELHGLPHRELPAPPGLGQPVGANRLGR